MDQKWSKEDNFTIKKWTRSFSDSHRNINYASSRSKNIKICKILDKKYSKFFTEVNKISTKDDQSYTIPLSSSSENASKSTMNRNTGQSVDFWTNIKFFPVIWKSPKCFKNTIKYRELISASQNVTNREQIQTAGHSGVFKTPESVSRKHADYSDVPPLCDFSATSITQDQHVRPPT